MAENHRKIIEVVAGPNGSGKSTFAEAYLVKQGISPLFINPDTIAAGISPGSSDEAAFAAGRLMISAVNESLQHGKNFAFESTLSGRTWLNVIKRAGALDYHVRIYFLYLKNVRENLKRIKQRVAAGGHDIPKATVERRFPRTFQQFWNSYRPLANDWYVIDNSGSKPVFVMSSELFENLDDDDKNSFAQQFLGMMKNGKKAHS